jgi:hypothetical protein
VGVLVISLTTLLWRVRFFAAAAVHRARTLDYLREHVEELPDWWAAGALRRRDRSLPVVNQRGSAR